jgi:hypothetical protein
MQAGITAGGLAVSFPSSSLHVPTDLSAAIIFAEKFWT